MKSANSCVEKARIHLPPVFKRMPKWSSTSSGGRCFINTFKSHKFITFIFELAVNTKSVSLKQE